MVKLWMKLCETEPIHYLLQLCRASVSRTQSAYSVIEVNGTRYLIMACGNTLRSDDGVGPWLAAWAQNYFRSHDDVRVISRLQWTPDLVGEIARCESVLFIDASVQSMPGEISLTPVFANRDWRNAGTHHLDATHLLAICEELYGASPRNSLLLTIGIGSTALGEIFSEPVTASLPLACEQIRNLLV